MLNWSSLEAFHPADSINSYYFDGNLASPDKLGEPTLRLPYQLPTSTLFIFPFQNPIYPDAQNRFSSDTIYGSSIAFSNATTRVNSQDILSQYALLYDFMIGSSDITLHYIHHIDRRQPVMFYDISTFELIPVFLPVDQFGGTYQFAYGQYLLKSEWSYRQFENVSDSNYGALSQLDHTQFAIGAERTHYHDNNYESTFLLEVQRFFGVSKDDRASLGFFQNDLFLGYRLSLNDSHSRIYLISYYRLRTTV